MARLKPLPDFLQKKEQWLAAAVAQLALRGCGREESGRSALARSGLWAPVLVVAAFDKRYTSMPPKGDIKFMVSIVG